LIFAIGAGHVSVSGSGNGGLNGAMMVVNTATPAVIVDPTAPGFGSPAGTYVGIPYFDGRGGGTGTWAFNKGSTDGDGDPQYLAPVRLWFQLLRVAS
jgi:hypothetical protein